MPDAEVETRAAVVALAGAPNVGKSTLLNRIIGQPLSIITPKPQTTRARVLGVYTEGTLQLVFTDTPGVLEQPRTLIDQRTVKRARAGIREADVTCWIVAADRGLGPTDHQEIPRLAQRQLLVVLNKIDLVKKPSLLPLMAEVDRLAPRTECIPLSALTGENVDVLMRRLGELASPGPWLYPQDTLTDQPMRFFAAELIREQIMRQLQQELPYRVAVKVETYRDEPRRTYIEASIYVDAASARKIVIGRGGERIKAIGTAARRRIEEMIGRHVYLALEVRVKKAWQRDPRFLDEVGL